MAITPSQASQLTPEEMVSIENAERAIDAKLAKEYKANQESVYITDLVESLTLRARALLYGRYEKAGWKVNVTANHDFRGEPCGSAIFLTAK